MDTQAYQNAKDALETQDYKAAERAFKVVLDSIDVSAGGSTNGSTSDTNTAYNSVQSYYGLVQVLNSNGNGLLLCRDSASNELSDGDVFLNLACAEWASNNRKRAIDAVRHGIKIDTGHEQLNRACAKLDCRRRCCFAFLARAHKLNRFIGRMMRRPAVQPLTVHNLLF